MGGYDKNLEYNFTKEKDRVYLKYTDWIAALKLSEDTIGVQSGNIRLGMKLIGDRFHTKVMEYYNKEFKPKKTIEDFTSQRTIGSFKYWIEEVGKPKTLEQIIGEM